MSGTYDPADATESIATTHAALDAGVTLLDTADFYGMGHNELLIARALRDRDQDQVAINVKFGAQRDPDGAWLGFDARPAAVKTALTYTLPAPARPRSRRGLPAGPARPGGADRGHRRRHRRVGVGRPRPGGRTV